MIERVLAAPVELLWRLWTEPENFASWYGPPAPGWLWRRWACASAAPAWVTVESTDHEGGTKLVLTHRGIPAGSPGAAGWAMAMDKLADHADDLNTR